MDKYANDQAALESKEEVIHELNHELEIAWTQLSDKDHEIERLEGKVKVMGTFDGDSYVKREKAYRVIKKATNRMYHRSNQTV